MISIIIPIYNVEQYLEQCLESIRNQTFSEFEVILVNDGSTDNSAKICEAYCRIDHRFRLFHKQNEGQGIARNFGISMANGQWLTFVDSDDYLDKNYLELLVKPTTMINSIDLVIGGYKKVDNEEQVFYKEIYPERTVSTQELSHKILGAIPDREDSIKGTVWNSLYKTDIISSNNITFQSERVFFSEDTLFNLDYLKYSKENYLVSSDAYCYRLNLSSTSTKFDGKKLQLINDYYHYVLNRFGEDDREAKIRVSKIYLVNLKRVIFQEKINPKNYHLRDILKNIREILSDNTVREVLSDYPINQLNNRKSQVIFQLCKYKQAMLLSYLIWNGIGRDKRYVKEKG
ncbi:glycosyltransferase family 2 protein [Streptococcus saliviloxodontae]|uniref:Glycosyltransferase involved in cell wall biosynthesis n=1 Tax=Streptococcus saliviloxodontae TaxID=1349416 RepID=A0ABS2PL22_9STRE|nr:glycosyltransferase family 2 protein [Streptococcus saliviloxodontae]MBM7635987.1 glycosyltransferase involved in cell wall biosynthesis [Streptococcus saliviloxodontae]